MRVNIKKMSLKKLQELIHEQGPEVYVDVIDVLKNDPRGGAQKLVRLCQTRLDEWKREKERLGRMYSYERQVWAMGYRQVAGVDEVGRGPLAGPVVAAAVILPGELSLLGLEEVRRLTGKRRQELYEQIREKAVAVGIGMVHPEGIDEANVMMATYKAMVKAVTDLSVQPDYLLIDALHLPGVAQPQAPIAGGDGQSCSIAAASVVAKVIRDEYMIEMDKQYPQYGFASHKGYGTQEHRAALERYGPCPIHRKTYGSVREIMSLSSGAMFADD
ncbi:MAG TPA: ribonuclease HII [Symbiobacteriaceae bacterium]|nr:ribonuclease HII [Symbiobacteriaceae bacterium]